jgi:hypothetical protein
VCSSDLPARNQALPNRLGSSKALTPSASAIGLEPLVALKG